MNTTTQPLAVIVAPDLVSVDHQCVLNAALYFDVVYADFYSFAAGPREQIISATENTLEMALDSDFAKSTSFAALRSAQILLRPPSADRVKDPEVAFGHELPEPLQQLLEKSIQEGAVMSVIQWMISAIVANKPAKLSTAKSRTVRMELSLPARPDIDRLRARDTTHGVALSLQLATMLNTLEVSASCGATPLLDTRANADLAHAVALQFPSIAAALSRDRVHALPWKHASLASKVLSDALLNVRVRDEADILYLRELLAPELFGFRAELGRLAALVKSQPWESGFVEDVEATIATSIRPQLVALERRLTKPSRRILKHLVSDWKSVSAVSVLPFSACVLQGADAAWAALAGACAGLGLGAIRAKLDEWSVRDDSALTYLFEVRRTQQKRA